jgi:hypothetical protein
VAAETVGESIMVAKACDGDGDGARILGMGGGETAQCEGGGKLRAAVEADQ